MSCEDLVQYLCFVMEREAHMLNKSLRFLFQHKVKSAPLFCLLRSTFIQGMEQVVIEIFHAAVFQLFFKKSRHFRGFLQHEK